MMALGGITGTGLEALLNGLGNSKSAHAATARRAGTPAGPKPQKAEKGAEESGAMTEVSPRVQVRMVQVRLLFEATIKISRQVKRARGGGKGEAPNLAAQLAEILAGHAEAFEADEAGVRPIDRLAEMYTPQATAGRIFDFATSWYGQWLDGRENSEENRAAFAEYIGAAVEKGFREAQAVLGVLPEKVQADIDETHELVFNAFEDFIANGLTKDPRELATAQGAGLAFNATFGAFSDPAVLMDDLLDRLNSDGSLRLDGVPEPHDSGQLLDLVA